MLVIPLVALVARAPWGDMASLLASESLRSALRLSLLTATIATLVCVIVGVPLAWLLARVTFPGRRFVRALVTVPLVLPPVVAGVALLTAFGRQGFIGAPLRDVFGVTIPFSTTAVVLAQVFVAMPFLVIAVESSFRSADPTLDEEAATAGASRWQTFRLINVPLALPGILSRSRARLGPGDRRVRRDHHVRRQRTGRHADDAAGDLHRAADRSGTGDRAQHRAAGTQRRGARRPAGEVVDESVGVIAV